MNELTEHESTFENIFEEAAAQFGGVRKGTAVSSPRACLPAYARPVRSSLMYEISILITVFIIDLSIYICICTKENVYTVHF